MLTAVVKMTSASPISYNRSIQSPKKDKELDKDYEERTWKERAHVVQTGKDKGHLCIPAMFFKNSIAGAAKYLSIKVPGKRNATWSKHFLSGIMVLDHLVLPQTLETIEPDWQFVPSDGKPGGSSRVWKCFPTVAEWSGEVVYHVLDETITKQAFEHHVEQAGKFIGLGRWRPQKGGLNGRYSVDSIKWMSNGS